MNGYEIVATLRALTSQNSRRLLKPMKSKSVFSRLIALVALIAILGVTALGWLSSRYGWRFYLEIFSHFQLQYCVISLLLLGVLWLTRHKTSMLIGLFCVALLITQVAIWYLPEISLSSERSANLRILVANINTQNRSYDKVISLVREEQPDVAVFMEIDQTWVEQLDSLQNILPHVFGQANPYNLGLVVYSKQALVNPAVEFFGTEKNASVLGQLPINGQVISLVATHPLPPAKSSFFHARNRQLDLISQYIKTVESPVVLVGDLNTTMWSPYYKKLVRSTGLKNARRGFGLLPTWPTRGTYHRIPDILTACLSIPIDHGLMSPELKVTDIRTGPDTGSDHRPLILDLRVGDA